MNNKEIEKQLIPTTVDGMFENYLKLTFTKGQNISERQKEEMKKVHYAAVSSLLVVFKQDYNEEKLHKILNKIEKDILNFWSKYIEN